MVTVSILVVSWSVLWSVAIASVYGQVVDWLSICNAIENRQNLTGRPR